jgi:hypothetical protein
MKEGKRKNVKHTVIPSKSHSVAVFIDASHYNTFFMYWGCWMKIRAALAPQKNWQKIIVIFIGQRIRLEAT